ncbi:ABC transporter substrate-binding protein [Microbacterium sp. LWH7-1.2]|uniref:ABC transporter substrate-binding protein n=1 Tax=Microbacterium sp. LWH7-1.2 TaxID=3135257 RepID=UPI003139A2DE
MGGTATDAGYFPSTQPALEALNGGAADFATIVTSGALTGLTGTGDYLFLGVATESAGKGSSIVVPADSDIQKVDDLAGKSVAVTQGAAGEYIVDQAMLNHDMPADSIKKVYLGPGDAAGAFTQGSVDAWAAFDIFIPAAVNKMGARILTTGDEELTGKPDYPVLVVTRSFAEAHPDVTAAVLKGYTEGGQHLIDNPDEYLSIQKAANDFSPEQMQYLADYRLLTYKAYDEQTRAELQETIDSWNQIGTLSKKLNVDDIVFDVASVPTS